MRKRILYVVFHDLHKSASGVFIVQLNVINF
jgi:hypothetical protein